MKRLEIHPENPQKRLMQQVVEVFQNGGLVIFPTGAGYSVGCDAMNKKALNRLYHVKRSIKKYYMAIMISEYPKINEFAELETFAYRYMKDRWPGPYTFILPATKWGKKTLDVKRPEIAFRMPDHPFVNTLHELYDHPILVTAAKIHDDDYFIDPDDIIEKFGKQVDLVVDSGSLPITPTTIISLVEGEPEIVREGEGLI